MDEVSQSHQQLDETSSSGEWLSKSTFFFIINVLYLEIDTYVYSRDELYEKYLEYGKSDG